MPPGAAWLSLPQAAVNSGVLHNGRIDPRKLTMALFDSALKGYAARRPYPP